MKRTSMCILTALLLVSLASAAFGETLIKVANSGPANPDNRTVKAVEIFKALVESGTGGEVTVQAHHASSLGSEREALEGVRLGTIEMGTLSSGPVPGFFKPVMVFDIPYLFSSAPAAWHTFNGAFGDEFNEAFRKKTGVRILGITENGYRHFSNRERPLKTAEDMAGLKIRTMENPAHMEMVKALGANPTPIAFGELYMALQQNVVDGMECPIVLYHDMKFYEVQKYLILDGHLYNPLFIFINDRFFQKKLTGKQQKVVADAAKVLAAVHNGFSQEANIKGIKALRDKGMEIYEPTLQEVAEFRKIAQPPALDFIKEKAGDNWVSQILKSAEKSEAAIGDTAKQVVQQHIDNANRKYRELVGK